MKDGSFRPLPVRERKIPKPGGSGKVRKLGIPTVADRVVQAALKLVLEPIFEADFLPVSYGFRPKRRAQDAIAEIHHFGTRGYRWVLDADIEACFDSISHSALMDRVRARVKDKRVLALVKAFLKAGVLTELGDQRDTHTGTPQGGILSPVDLANIALSVLDEHLHRDRGSPAGRCPPARKRAYRRHQGPADVADRPLRRRFRDPGARHAGRRPKRCAKTSPTVLAPMGLRLSPAKTQVVHMSDGFDFLGFRIQWKRKRGTNKWYVYTFIADRPVRSVKAKIRALTHRTSQARPQDVLIRLNQIMRGWANYFRHAVAKHTFRMLGGFVWHRVIMWLEDAASLDVEGRPRAIHRPHGSWLPISRGRGRTVQSGADTGNHPVPLPGRHDPHPLGNSLRTQPDGRNHGEPDARKRARRVRRAAWRNGPAATPEPRSRPTQPSIHSARRLSGRAKLRALACW